MNRLKALQSRKILWVMVLVMTFVFCLSSVSSISITTFNDSTSEGYLRFINNNTYTKYISIPNTVNKITSASFNITGYSYGQIIKNSYYNYPSPVIYYSMNSTSHNATFIKNDAGYQFNGTIYGNVSFAEDYMVFNGTYGDIVVTDSTASSLGLSYNLTFSAFINRRTSSVNEMPILTREFGSTSNFNFYVNNTGGLTMRNFRGSWRYYYSNASINENEWTHVAITCQYNPSYSLLRFYINGIPSGDYTALANSECTSTVLSSIYLRVGAAFISDDQFFNGTIDEVTVFSKELKEAEIKDIYNNYTINLTKTSSYFPFDSNIKIGNDQIFNYSGAYSSNQRTNDLATTINKYLNSTYLISSNYIIPISFNALNRSNLYYSSIDINNLGFINNNLSYNLTTYETSQEGFIINITYDDSYYTSSSANFVYDGTSYSTTKIINGNNIIFSKNIIIPDVASSINKTFYWQVALTNSSGTFYYNSSLYNQTVNNVNIDDCSSYSFRLFNFTNYDEDTKTLLVYPINNNSFEFNMVLGNSGLTNSLNYSNSKSNVNSFAVCSNVQLNNSNRIDANLKYSSTDHVTEYYNLQNYITNGSTNNIKLYDLLTTSSQEFLITFKDGNLIPIKDALIDIRRDYNGDYATVEIPKTDNDGRTIGHFVLNDILYNIYIRKNGVLLASYEGVTAYCASTDCRLNLNAQLDSTTFDKVLGIGGLLYKPEYNSTTRIYTFDFISQNGTSKTINLVGVLFNNDLNNTICNQTITSSDGTLTCSIPSTYENSTLLIRITSDGIEAFNDILSIRVKGTDLFESIKIVIIILMVITIVGIFVTSSHIMLLFGFFMAVILSSGMYLIDGGIIGIGSSIIYIILVIIFIIAKLAMKENQR